MQVILSEKEYNKLREAADGARWKAEWDATAKLNDFKVALARDIVKLVDDGTFTWTPDNTEQLRKLREVFDKYKI
jgi:hypothetical protein